MQISKEVLEPTIKLIYRGFNAITFHTDCISNGVFFLTSLTLKHNSLPFLQNYLNITNITFIHISMVTQYI